MHGIVQECKEFSILFTFPDSVYRRFAKARNKKKEKKLPKASIESKNS